MTNPFTSRAAPTSMAAPIDPWAAEDRDIAYQRRMAEQLAAQGQEPLQGQMIGNRFVAPHWTQQLAKSLAKPMAERRMRDLDERAAQLAQGRTKEFSETLSKALEAMHGAPPVMGTMPEGVMGPPPILQDATPGDPKRAMSILAQSNHPAAQQIVMARMLSGLEPPKPNEPFTLSEGQRRFDGTGKEVAAVAPKPIKQEKPFIRTRVMGDQEIQEQLQPDGSYQEIGRGPRFARQVAPVVHVGSGTGKAPSGYRFNAAGELEAIPGGPADKKASQKLPTSALKMQQEELDAIGTSSTINADLGAIESQIDNGKLKLGAVSNLAAKAKNFVGASDESSRNLATFQATLEKLRNDSLRLNKGVQTEGDAQRAWNELVANINDPKLVKQRLGEIRKINERATTLRKMNIDAIRTNFGVEPMDTSAREVQPPAVGGSAPASPVDALLKKYGG